MAFRVLSTSYNLFASSGSHLAPRPPLTPVSLHSLLTLLPLCGSFSPPFYSLPTGLHSPPTVHLVSNPDPNLRVTTIAQLRLCNSSDAEVRVWVRDYCPPSFVPLTHYVHALFILAPSTSAVLACSCASFSTHLPLLVWRSSMTQCMRAAAACKENVYRVLIGLCVY